MIQGVGLSQGLLSPLSTREPKLPEHKEISPEVLKRQQKLRQATQDVEGFFLSMLMKQMREAGPKNEMFHGGRGEDVFQGRLDMERGKDMAASGGIGIGETLYKNWEWTTHFSPQNGQGQS